MAEYAGPLLITVGLIALRNLVYGKASSLTVRQKLGLVLVIGHYLKREIETIFVHRFSAETMPLGNLFKNCAHYWILFGWSMYQFLRPHSAQTVRSSEFIFACLFVVFEYLNLKTHQVLRDLRKPGSTERGIPFGYGFN